MPVNECKCCGGEYFWRWEEAFDKFGFGDGDGQVETPTVEAVLENAGFTVKSEPWGMHNTVILSICKDGVEAMPHENSKFIIGYDDPRSYLPSEIVELLDRELPETAT